MKRLYQLLLYKLVCNFDSQQALKNISKKILRIVELKNMYCSQPPIPAKAVF